MFRIAFLPTCTLSPFAGSRLPHRTAELRSAPPRPRDHAVSGRFPGPRSTATFSPGVLIHSSPHRFEASVKGSDPAGEVPVGDAAPADVLHEGRERFLVRTLGDGCRVVVVVRGVGGDEGAEG